jgi:carbon storage regulator
MLVMSRREGEVILIGDEIEIVITHIGRSRVKVGIQAPRAMSVVAREVKLVRDENRAAAQTAAGESAALLKFFHSAPMR